MNARILFVSTVLSLCFVSIAFADGLDDKDDRLVTVDSRVTWTSVFMSEVHLLIHNHSAEDLKVTTTLGYNNQQKIICAKNIDETDIQYRNRAKHRGRMLDADRYSSYVNIKGIVNRGGWLHRSFTLGKNGWIAPCQVPYRIYFPNSDRAPIEGVIDVPGQVGLEYGDQVSSNSLEVEHIVEEYDYSTDYFILRLLVTNKEAYTLKVGVTDIDFTCDGDSRAQFSLHGGPQNGLRFGPLYIRSHRWGSFEILINVKQSEATDKCRGWVELSVDEKSGHKVPLKKVLFRLTANGFYSIVAYY